MADNVSKQDKDPNNRNPTKKVHQIYDKTLIVIDESLVYKLGINDDTWMEQEQLENGILLKIKPIVSPPSNSSSDCR